METWEAHFREKSARRSRHRYRDKAMKAGILILIAGGIAAALWIKAAGLAG
jgi:hypothetical protein